MNLIKFEFILLEVGLFLDDTDRSALASTCKSVKDMNNVWASLYLQRFGRKLNSNANVTRARETRRHSSCCSSYFQQLRDQVKIWACFVQHLYRKDFNKKQFCDLLKKWEFPLEDTNKLNKRYRVFENQTLLGIAVRFQRWRVVKFLLAIGACPIACVDTTANSSILLVAAWAGKIEIVKSIIKSLENSTSNDDKDKEKLRALLTMEGRPPKTSSCGSNRSHVPIMWTYRKLKEGDAYKGIYNALKAAHLRLNAKLTINQLFLYDLNDFKSRATITEYIMDLALLTAHDLINSDHCNQFIDEEIEKRSKEEDGRDLKLQRKCFNI